MTQTPERRHKSRQSDLPEQTSTLSTAEIKAEIDHTLGNLKEAQARELAARIRSAGERTPEAEVALQTRREEVSRIHRRYIRLLDELEGRNESYP